MAVVRSRESTELPTASEMEEERRELSGDVATARSPEVESEVVANSIGSLLQRVAGSSVHDIDQLIAELRAMRTSLESEGARVQREIVEYAHLSQSAMQTTKVIAENLAGRRVYTDALKLSTSDEAPQTGPVTQESCRAITGLRPDGEAVSPVQLNQESASRAKRFGTR
jgi:hypothetical protein